MKHRCLPILGLLAPLVAGAAWAEEPAGANEAIQAQRGTSSYLRLGIGPQAVFPTGGASEAAPDQGLGFGANLILGTGGGSLKMHGEIAVMLQTSFNKYLDVDIGDRMFSSWSLPIVLGPRFQVGGELISFYFSFALGAALSNVHIETPAWTDSRTLTGFASQVEIGTDIGPFEVTGGTIYFRRGDMGCIQWLLGARYNFHLWENRPYPSVRGPDVSG